MKIDLCAIGTCLMVFMFLYSGSKKVFTAGKDAETKKLTSLGISEKISPVLMVLAGIFEILASIVAIAYVTKLVKFDKNIFNLALWSLIAFTLLVTALFKFYPKFRPVAITANIAVVGGLLAVLSCNR